MEVSVKGLSITGPGIALHTLQGSRVKRHNLCAVQVFTKATQQLIPEGVPQDSHVL
jgi:hypothetical protein